jgi:LacI family transcriptional regulator
MSRRVNANKPAAVTTKPARPAGQVSQREIGELAGVSQATVSLVLAGRKVNSDETRRRVLEAAQQLKYRPNLLVHGMQTGKSKMIGVMAPPFDYFWSRILYGIHDALAEHDYVPINVWPAHHGRGPEVNAPESDELTQLHRLLDRRVEGVIFWPPSAALFVDHVDEFTSRELPIVVIDHELPANFRADSVGSDETIGGKLVADHLVQLGHRRIVHLSGPDAMTWGRLRRQSFESALAEHGVKCVVREAPTRHPSFAADLIRSILTEPKPPTAIYAASDPLARVVYRVAHELGISIPKDLSVVGFADDDFAAELIPPLTTVRQPGYEIGRRAADLLIARAGGTYRKGGRRDVLPVTLEVRESTARPGDR